MIELWRGVRQFKARREQRLRSIDVHGLEHLRDALGDGAGVLITPNHASHADPYVMLEVAERVDRPFYFMVAWQLLAGVGKLSRAVLRWHGAFSVNREGTDWAAITRANEVLRSKDHPLVVFPEGDIYHHNDRLAPFHEGCGIIAQTAARRSQRPIVCIPCAVRYEYVSDPTPELESLTLRLEQATDRTPRPGMSLARRVQRLVAGLLRMKEHEFLGRHLSGSATERAERLSEAIVGNLEAKYGRGNGWANVTARVQSLRQRILTASQNQPNLSYNAAEIEQALADLSFVVQLYSYPPDYLESNPTLERVAETLDRLEEDVLGVPIANARGTRRVSVTFGEPIPVVSTREWRQAATSLTRRLEMEVHALLHPHEHRPQPRPVAEPLAVAST